MARKKRPPYRLRPPPLSLLPVDLVRTAKRPKALCGDVTRLEKFFVTPVVSKQHFLTLIAADHYPAHVGKTRCNRVRTPHPSRRFGNVKGLQSLFFSFCDSRVHDSSEPHCSAMTKRTFKSTRPFHVLLATSFQRICSVLHRIDICDKRKPRGVSDEW